MSLTSILELIMGVLKFPAEVRALVQLLSKTPEEKRQEIMAKIQAESDSAAETGRPSW